MLSNVLQNVLLLSNPAGRKPLSSQLLPNQFSVIHLFFFYIPQETIASSVYSCSVDNVLAVLSTTVRQELSKRPEFWLPFNINFYGCFGLIGFKDPKTQLW